MAEPSSFGKLWERARRGDRDAQADLYLEFGPRLRRIIRRKLRDLNITWAVEPNDLLDSFFIRLYTGGAKIRIKDALHFTNYCEQALRNSCVRVLRAVIPRLATRIEECPPELFEDFDATTAIEQVAWREQFAQAYSRLTHRERVICWLSLGWTYVGGDRRATKRVARGRQEGSSTCCEPCAG